MADHAHKHHGSDLVYATNFPREAGKFYHKFYDDGTVAWADLLFRGVEIATVPLRENNHDKMVEQMTAAGLDVSSEGFKYHLVSFQIRPAANMAAAVMVSIVWSKNNWSWQHQRSHPFPRDINRLTP